MLLAAKQVEYDQMLASAQAVAEEIHVIRESVLVLEGELQALRTEPFATWASSTAKARTCAGASRITGFCDPGATPLGQPNMDVDRDGDSKKKMRTGAPQNPEDVQSMISGISNDMLLMMLAQVKGRRKNNNPLEERRAAGSIEGGPEG